MNTEREFELRCEDRTGFTETRVEYYICPNQFDGELAFASGVDERMESEDEVRRIAFFIARNTMRNVTITVFRDDVIDEEAEITIKPTVKVA